MDNHFIQKIEDRGRHFDDRGRRCLCHGHCAACGLPVVMNKLGKYAHIVWNTKKNCYVYLPVVDRPERAKV